MAYMTGGLILGGTALAATGAEINRAADVSARVVVLATGTTLSATLHEGKTCRLTGTGSAFTQKLPAATGSGAKYRFEVGAANTSNHIIEVTTTDVMEGSVVTCQDSADTVNGWETAADSDRITLNGTTTGGLVGDWIEVEDVATGKWAVRGMTKATGTEATPFSAAVS